MSLARYGVTSRNVGSELNRAWKEADMVKIDIPNDACLEGWGKPRQWLAGVEAEFPALRPLRLKQQAWSPEMYLHIKVDKVSRNTISCLLVPHQTLLQAGVTLLLVNIMIVHPACVFTMFDIYTVYTPRVPSVTSLYYHYMFRSSWAIIRWLTFY
jgi:hypothetical protein